MANAERGEVDLVAGDATYTLRLSYNAIAEIETLLDKGINEITGMLRDPEDFRISRWRVLLWGGLREHHKLSLEEAGEVMRLAGIDPTVAAIGTAMKLGFPEMTAGEEENPRKASRGAGRRS